MGTLTSCGRRFFGSRRGGTMNSVAAPRRLSLLNSHHFPTVPSSTTPCIPRPTRLSNASRGPIEYGSLSASRRSRETSPFTRRFVDLIGPNQVHSLTDWSFASGCSPQGLSTPQLPPAFRSPASRPREDFHLPSGASSQTHERARLERWRGRPAVADFSAAFFGGRTPTGSKDQKVRFGGTPKPALETSGAR